jgi:hypothetical protein
MVIGTSKTKQQMWTSLWKLKVVPKIRVRVLCGILLDECNFKYQHIKDSSRCNVCLALDENLLHALITCSHAKGFGDEAATWLDIHLTRPHPYTWAKYTLCDLLFSAQGLAKIITVM